MRGIKRAAAAVLAAVLLLGLTACGQQSGGQTGSLRLYYPAALSARDKSTGGADAITSAQVSWKRVTGDDRGRQQQAQYIMELLLGGCKVSGFTSPVPVGTTVRSCTVTGGTVSDQEGRLTMKWTQPVKIENVDQFFRDHAEFFIGKRPS